MEKIPRPRVAATGKPRIVRQLTIAGKRTAYNIVGSSASPLNLLTCAGPASNDPVNLDFQQAIGANDPLRTGTYSKTLTFTLSTTTP